MGENSVPVQRIQRSNAKKQENSLFPLPCWNSGQHWNWPHYAQSLPAPSGKWCTQPTWQRGRIFLCHWVLRGWSDDAPSTGWGTAGLWALEWGCQTQGCLCCSPSHLWWEREETLLHYLLYLLVHFRGLLLISWPSDLSMKFRANVAISHAAHF